MKTYKHLTVLFSIGFLLIVFTGCSEDDKTYFINDFNSSVRVIHASYDAPDVDVYLNDSVAIEDLPYGESSGYASVSSDIYDIDVTPAGSDTPVVIALTDFALFPNVEITVFAMNKLASIQPVIADDFRYVLAGKARVRFVHASPDTDPVDIKVGAGDGPAVFSDVSFTDVEEYIAVDPGTYVFVVTAAGETTPLLTFESVTIEEETVYSIVAIGTFDGEDDYDLTVRVFIDNGAGDQFIDLVPVIPNGI